jgi:hypothetical protein
VLAALPFALYLDRLQQTREEHLRAAEANAAAARALETERQRVSEVLGLLRGELAENEKMLDVRRDTPWDVHPPFLRSDVWHALNASSATVGISAELIQQMARAYYFVEATALIEQETFRLSLDPMVRTIQWASVEAAGAGPSPLTAARNELSRTDGATRQAIHEAVLAMTDVRTSCASRRLPQVLLRQRCVNSR